MHFIVVGNQNVSEATPYRDRLIALGFYPVGTFEVSDERKLTWKLNGECSGPGTYAWTIELDGEIDEVSYVGLAGKSLHARLTQHASGFLGGSKRGVKNAQYLLENRPNNAVLSIWFRPISTQTVLGVDARSIELDEAIAIACLKPKLNKVREFEDDPILG